MKRKKRTATKRKHEELGRVLHKRKKCTCIAFLTGPNNNKKTTTATEPDKRGEQQLTPPQGYYIAHQLGLSLSLSL